MRRRIHELPALMSWLRRDTLHVEGCRGKDALCREIERAGLQEEIRVVETGCLGPCDDGPVIVVTRKGRV